MAVASPLDSVNNRLWTLPLIGGPVNKTVPDDFPRRTTLGSLAGALQITIESLDLTRGLGTVRLANPRGKAEFFGNRQ